MPSKNYLGYVVSWNTDWEIVSEQALTPDNPYPTVVAGLHFLLKGEDFVSWNAQPLYATDKRVCYMAYYNGGKVCVLSTTEAGGQLLYEEDFPIQFNFSPDLEFPEEWDRAAWFPLAVSYITFSPNKVLWVLFITIDANKDLQDAIGVLGAFPLDSAAPPQWLIFTIPPEVWSMPTWDWFPIAPTRQGILLRVQQVLNMTEPNPQGSGTKKWLFVKLNSSNQLTLKSFLLPEEALEVVIPPHRLVTGFNTSERVKVLSPYEGLRWEWDDENETFITIDTSRTPLALLPHPVGGYHDEFTFYALLPGYTYLQAQARYKATTTNPILSAFVFLQTTGREMQVVNLADTLRNITVATRSLTVPTWMEGDVNDAILYHSLHANEIIPLSFIKGVRGNSISITPVLGNKAPMWIAPVASKSPVIMSNMLQAPRIGTVIAPPDSDIYLPLWLPAYPQGTGQPHGHIVLAKYIRKAMPIIINPQLDVDASGHTVLRFAMPPTGTRKVKFAVENPPVGGLNWSYMSTSFIISDSIADRMGWEMRVNDTDWLPLNGVVSKPTPASPPFEIRVRVSPVYSPFLRVIMQEI